jgi:hypothetical protein
MPWQVERVTEGTGKSRQIPMVFYLKEQVVAFIEYPYKINFVNMLITTEAALQLSSYRYAHDHVAQDHVRIFMQKCHEFNFFFGVLMSLIIGRPNCCGP